MTAPMQAATMLAASSAPQLWPTLAVPPKITILYGDLRTGRILGEIDATGASWAQVLNGAGSVDQVTVPDDTIRALNLPVTCQAARSFLAVEIDDRIQEAGPIWSYVYDWEKGQVTLGAAGLWSLWDHRKVLKVLAAGLQVRTGADLGSVTLTGADLGEIARGLVALAMSHIGGDLPLVLPDPRPGSAHTETFPGYKLYTVSQQLKELTQRETAAPDIRFLPRRRADDRRFIEWVMQTGTEDAPQLSQVGSDWSFDTTAARGPVLGIGVNGDPTGMGMRGWAIGNGTDDEALMATAYDPTLVDLGWPLLEVDTGSARNSVEVWDTLAGHAANLVAQSARPIEAWKVTVHASAAREVTAGDYCRVVTKGHPWLGDQDRRMRVQRKSGGLDDRITLDMYPLEAVL